MHRLDLFQFEDSMSFAPAEEGRRGPIVGRPRVRVADVDGKELQEPPGSAIPCPAHQFWDQEAYGLAVASGPVIEGGQGGQFEGVGGHGSR